MLPLWISIEPSPSGVRLLLTEPSAGPSLKAVLPLPSDPRALPLLLESLCGWHQRPLCAVVDADAEDIQSHPERWALLAGDLAPAQLSIEWARRGARRRGERERFLEEIGSVGSGRRLLGNAVLGLP